MKSMVSHTRTNNLRSISSFARKNFTKKIMRKNAAKGKISFW